MLACIVLPRPEVGLARRLLAVSPLLEHDGELVFLDDRGLQRLHGGAAGLFAAIRAALAPEAPRGLALAANRSTAELAARCAGRAVSIAAGDEALFLSRLPLRALPLSAGLAQRLAPLGLATLGDFAALPAPGVRSRYGEEGLALHRLARGLDARELRPLREARVPSIERQLQAPADRLALLQPALAECVQRLCAWLAEEGEGAARLQVSLTLDALCADESAEAPAAAGARHELVLVLPEPEERAELLLDLLARRLAAEPPGASVTALRLVATQTGPLARHQNALFGEVARDAARRAEALARLAALFGPQAVARPRLRRAHRVEERWAERAAEGARSAPQSARQVPAASAPPGPALRWLPAPEELLPLMAGGALSGFRRGHCELSIARLSGPRRLTGGWWAAPWARDEYELVTSDGALYRIGRDLHAQRWLLLAEGD